MPSPLSREPNCSRVIKAPGINGQTGQHRQFVPTQVCISFSPVWYFIKWESRLFSSFAPFNHVKDNLNHGNHSAKEEMNHMSHSLITSKSSQVEFWTSNHGVILNDGFSGDGCRRLVGSTSNQQAQNLISAQKRKEIDTSNFHTSTNLPQKQANQRPHNQKHSLLDHVNRHWNVVVLR